MRITHQLLGVPEYELRLVFGRTKIDWDLSKEEVNRRKHGYSLESAAHLMRRLLLPVSSVPFATSPSRRINGEYRHEHMTIDEYGKVLYIVTTMRNPEIVRVISLRRASEEEREGFAQLTGYREHGSNNSRRDAFGMRRKRALNSNVMPASNSGDEQVESRNNLVSFCGEICN